MSPSASRRLAAASLFALAALAVTWLAWPEREPRADLEAAPAVTAPPATPTTVAASETLPTSTTLPAEPVIPIRVRIPAVGLDAPAVPVGLEPDGAMEIPPARAVGWYRLGPSPGERGSAVLAAHIDYGGAPGAFFDLRSVPVGAEVIVDADDGSSQSFTVTQREQLAKADIDLTRYFTAEGEPRLTLITCGGAFDRGAGRYQDNLVLTATPTATSIATPTSAAALLG